MAATLALLVGLNAYQYFRTPGAALPREGAVGRPSPAELKKSEEKLRQQEGGGYFRALVNTTADAGLLGKRPTIGQEPQFAYTARFVFEHRNSVVHKQKIPDTELAEQVFDAARRVIEYLVDNDSSRSRE